MLGLTGCAGLRTVTAPPPELPEAFPNHSAEEIIARMQLPADSLQSYRAEGRILVRSEDEGRSFGAEIYHRRDGPLFISISPGLGIVAARILVTPDSFYVYNRIENRLVYGSREHAATNLPIALPQERLFETMLGLLKPDPEAGWIVSADMSRYYLDTSDERYVVNPSYWRVLRYEQAAPDGAIVEVREYSAFEETGGHFLPREVILRRPEEQTLLQLHYGEIDLAPEEMRFDRDVSPSAERVLVDQRYE